MRDILLLILALLVTDTTAGGYRPVVLVGGLFASESTWSDTIKFLNKEFPGIDITESQKYMLFTTLTTDMWTQVKGVYNELQNKLTAKGDGVTLMCYSQGGLLCRAMLEMYPNMNVHTFIAISSPLAGQYGIPELLAPFLRVTVLDDAYKLLYTPVFQNYFSLANYWNDPYHQDLFMEHSIFLPKLDNCTGCYENFAKIQRLVLVGGEDDGVITPWQSSLFQFYAENNDKIVLEINATKMYKENGFGLRTLYDKDRVTVCTVNDIGHFEWAHDINVFEKCIRKWIT